MCIRDRIYSYHNFEETPPQDELVEKMKQMFLRGCDIAKIAVMPKSSADVLALLGATEEMKQLFPNCPIITMSMGRLGMVSRLCGETFGSALTFGSAARASAPGQVPALELRRTLEPVSYTHLDVYKRQGFIDPKATKRRVSAEIWHREPGKLQTGTEGRAEHGLGAAQSNGFFPLDCDGSARHCAGVSDASDERIPHSLRPAP